MYSNIISLGAWCQVSEQLRKHKIQRTLSPLEWTVATWSATLAVLRDRGQRLCEDLIISENGKDVICQTYGLLHPHDFAQIPDGSHMFLPLDQQQLDVVRTKYRHKMNEMLTACQANKGRIAFLRMGGEAEPAVAWPYLHDRTPLTTERVNEMADALVEFCGHRNFDLFILLHEGWHPYQQTTDLHPNVQIKIMPYPAPPVDWYGHADDWNVLLQELGLLETPTMPPSALDLV